MGDRNRMSREVSVMRRDAQYKDACMLLRGLCALTEAFRASRVILTVHGLSGTVLLGPEEWLSTATVLSLKLALYSHGLAKHHLRLLDGDCELLDTDRLKGEYERNLIAIIEKRACDGERLSIFQVQGRWCDSVGAEINVQPDATGNSVVISYPMAGREFNMDIGQFL